ncbi:type III-B CRISPR module RAMP protein Cmr1 [Nocardiopsis kunsanensis]|uniref:type III-B CRISPR module RAMP protein Cmr1 n=1 Tax=Nocardiopsis kunsanensis TaxID=141693 RepID=UPI0003475124|nr:type III-B CRISPR module RAMP protein Cmr1 [Nocardiopsis kunsanensis]
MWHSLQLQVVTPVFNSAGAQDTPHLNTPPEIRVPSLRGGMRFWLRAMAARYVGDDPHLLRKVENKCLGSTERSSSIAIRISGNPEPASQDLSTYMSEEEQTWIGYLLGQAFTTKGKPHTKAYVPPNREFQIKIRRQHGDDDAVTCALAALWLNITYGGVGARVRRGFGRLRITDADMTLAGWDSETIRTPHLNHYFEAGHTGHIGLEGLPHRSVEALHRVCAEARGEDPKEFQLPGHRTKSTLSSLGESHTISGLSAPLSASGWQEALARTGKELRYFRAQRDEKHTENARGPHIKTKGWKDVILGEGHEMPRAALGLPVGYKDGREVRAFRGPAQNPEQLRRSSPLWIRPIVQAEQWHLFSFAFLNEFLPESGGPQGARVGLFKEGKHKKNITVKNDDIRTTAKEWTEELACRADAFSNGRPQ